jgi:hypothetical protein
VAKSDDEPDLGEIKGLLRRLEGAPEPSNEIPLSHSVAHRHEHPGWAQASQRRPSSGAVLFLIANTVMATATITSIAWYLYDSVIIQRRAEPKSERDGDLAVANEQAPSRAATPSETRLAAAPSVAVASGSGGDAAPSSEQSSEQGSAEVAAPVVATAPANEPVVPEIVVRADAPAAIEVAAGLSTRFPIELEPAGAEIVDLISVRGLPDGVYFNRGSPAGRGMWSVPAGTLAGLELATTDAASAGKFELFIAVRAANGRALASARSTVTISGHPVAPSSTTSDTARQGTVRVTLVEKARNLLAVGQVVAARLLLQRAAETGNAEAALLLGETFDPVRGKLSGIHITAGDRETARLWYERAAELGSPEGKARASGQTSE